MTLYAAFGILIVIAVWVVVRMLRGHILGSTLVLFERSYDDAYRELPSKPDALRQAFRVFAAAPKIRALRQDDVDAIVDIVGAADDPKRVIREIVVRLNASRALQAFGTEVFSRNSPQQRAREGAHELRTPICVLPKRHSTSRTNS